MKNQLIKTFESFMDHLSMEPHQVPGDEMPMQPAGIKHGEQHQAENYMFFGNLETVHRLAGIMLKMDPLKVDEILKNGHNWAVDHIATSKDDMEEVANFLIGEMTEVAETAEGQAEYTANEGAYSCNECGMAYEKTEMYEGHICKCGGEITAN